MKPGNGSQLVNNVGVAGALQEKRSQEFSVILPASDLSLQAATGLLSYLAIVWVCGVLGFTERGQVCLCVCESTAGLPAACPPTSFFEYLSSFIVTVLNYYWRTFLNEIAVALIDCYNFHRLSFGTINNKSKN